MLYFWKKVEQDMIVVTAIKNDLNFVPFQCYFLIIKSYNLYY